MNEILDFVELMFDESFKRALDETSRTKYLEYTDSVDHFLELMEEYLDDRLPEFKRKMLDYAEIKFNDRM